jgi:hypothetical protein
MGRIWHKAIVCAVFLLIYFVVEKNTALVKMTEPSSLKGALLLSKTAPHMVLKNSSVEINAHLKRLRITFFLTGCELKPLDREMVLYWGVTIKHLPGKILEDMYDYCKLRVQGKANGQADAARIERVCGKTIPKACTLQTRLRETLTIQEESSRLPKTLLGAPQGKPAGATPPFLDKAKITDSQFATRLKLTFHQIGCKLYDTLPRELLDFWESDLLERDILSDMWTYCSWAQKKGHERQRRLCGVVPTHCKVLKSLHGGQQTKVLLADPFTIGDSIISFVDPTMVGSLGKAQLASAKAQAKNVVFRGHPNSPGIQNYFNFVEDYNNSTVVHMYYRCDPLPGDMAKDGNDGSICYGRSDDQGMTFTTRQINPASQNNMLDVDKQGHAFFVFVDRKPGIPDTERYKAIGVSNERYSHGGWVPYVSKDGVHWKKLPNIHLFSRSKFMNANQGRGILYAFDSLNQIRWDPFYRKYVANVRVVRDWKHRTFLVQMSDNWLQWDDLGWKDAQVNPAYIPGEGTYVLNADRCPAKECAHMYIGTTTRYNGNTFGSDCFAFVGQGHGADCEDGATDVALLFAQNEANPTDGPIHWVRPSVETVADFGQHHPAVAKLDDDRSHWTPRNTFATHGLFDRKQAEEMWFYVLHDATWPSAHVQRYSLGRFRFGAISCPGARWSSSFCTVELRPFWVNLKSAKDLILNLRTNTVFGYVKAKLQFITKDRTAAPVAEDFTFSSSTTFVGDELEHPMRWGEARWVLRRANAVIEHQGPNTKMYKKFVDANSRPYNTYRTAKGKGLGEFLQRARSPGIQSRLLLRKRVEEGHTVEEVAVLVSLEMLDAKVFAVSVRGS